MPETPTPQSAPPPLTVAASLVGIEGFLLLVLAVLAVADVESDRPAVGISTGVFFAAYGALLIGGAWALWRRAAWARGPVLITQLIMLGLAWGLRDHVAAAIGLALVALVVLAGMLHPDSIAALTRGSQASESND